MSWLFTLCYFFSLWCAFSLPSLRSGTAVWVTLGCVRASVLSLMDLSWSVTTEDLLLQLHFLTLPCLHMYIFWMEKKSELIFKSHVPQAHTFWIEKQGDLIWSGPKSPGTPFHFLLLLQNFSCYSSFILVQCTETDRDWNIPFVIA